MTEKGKKQSDAEREKRMTPSGKVCVCGATYEDFCRTGLLGCAHCYTTFREELTEIVARTQFGVRHVGRAPSGGNGSLQTLMNKQACLREEMEAAVRTGREEDAVRLERALFEIDRLISGGIK